MVVRCPSHSKIKWHTPAATRWMMPFQTSHCVFLWQRWSHQGQQNQLIRNTVNVQPISHDVCTHNWPGWLAVWVHIGNQPVQHLVLGELTPEFPSTAPPLALMTLCCSDGASGAGAQMNSTAGCRRQLLLVAKLALMCNSSCHSNSQLILLPSVGVFNGS